MKTILTTSALLLFLITATLSANATLRIKGQILSGDDTVEMQIVVGDETHIIPLSRKNKFEVILDCDEIYTVRVSQQGMLTKTVVISTATPDNSSLRGVIALDIQMEPGNGHRIDEKLCAFLFWSEEIDNFMFRDPVSVVSL